jgi:hypothetical protein
MANLLRQNPLAFLLAVLGVALTAIIVVEVAVGLWPHAVAESAKPSGVSDVRMLPPLAAVLPDNAYPETAARPLFTPTRRPAPAAPAVAGNMVKGQYTLQGVIAVGDLRIALLKEKTSGKVIRVERGKDVNGITLSVVDPDKVTLAQGGDEEVLTLQVSKAAPTPAGGNPAVAAPPQSSGPFATGQQPGAAPNVPGGPTPAAVGATPSPPVAPPGAAAPAAAGAANPAQRSGFGPFQANPSSNPTDAATPMTPEELLARRRARRGLQQPNQ